MPQDQASGAAAREFGLRMGRAVASLLETTCRRAGSNEVIWRGKPAVIKSCNEATTSFGVTATMLDRIDRILLAIKDAKGGVTVYDVPADAFRTRMRDSRSSHAIGGKVKLMSTRDAIAKGVRIGSFPAAEVRAALSQMGD